MKTILETPRLLLREFSMEDAKDVLELHSNPDVQRYTGEAVVTSLEEVKKGIENVWENEYKKYGFARWATIFKGNKRFVGWAGLKYLPEFDAVDLGYRFIPAYWGKGIASEISGEILRYGFETLNLDRIIGISMKENLASIRVLEKSGMLFDKYAPYEEGDEEDAVWYALTRAEYDQTISSGPK